MVDIKGFSTTNVDNVTIETNTDGKIQIKNVMKEYSQTGNDLAEGDDREYYSTTCVNQNWEEQTSMTASKSANNVKIGASFKSVRTAGSGMQIKKNGVAILSTGWNSTTSYVNYDVLTDLEVGDVISFWIVGYNSTDYTYIKNCGVVGSFELVTVNEDLGLFDEF